MANERNGDLAAQIRELKDATEFLKKSTESLHSTAAELTEQMRIAQQNDAARRLENARLQRGILKAIQAYLDETADGGEPSDH